MDIREYEAKAKEQLMEAEERAAKARAEVAALGPIKEKWGDAERACARVRPYDDREVWASKAVHTAASRIDPVHMAVSVFNGIEPCRRVPFVLYATVETPTGEVRVYSALHVDIIEGFQRFYDGEFASLVDALRSTTDAAEKAHAAYEAECKAAQDAQAAIEAAKKKTATAN